MGFTNFPPTLTVTGSVKITTPITVQKVIEQVTVAVTELPPPPSSIASILTVRYTLTATTKKRFNAFPLKTGLTVWADPTNGGLVYIGGTTVTANSAALSPGGSLTLPIDTAAILYALATHSGDRINIVGA